VHTLSHQIEPFSYDANSFNQSSAHLSDSRKSKKLVVRNQSNDARYNRLYQQAEQIRRRLSSERKKKELEELRECTFHPKRRPNPSYIRPDLRPNSVNVNRSDIVMSLERLVPSKDKMNLREIVKEQNSRDRELKEVEQCTFKPKFEKPIIDKTKKIDKLPGMKGHVDRLKSSQEEDNRKKSFYDNLGSKYKCTPTEVQPFRLSESRDSFGNLLQKNSPSRTQHSFQQLKKSPIKSLNQSPIKQNPITSPQKPLSRKDMLEETKGSAKYAKLRIHYTKDKFAEIKVFEDTDPTVLSGKFCKEFNLAEPMKKQLQSIIRNKLESLRSLGEVDYKNFTSSDKNSNEWDKSPPIRPQHEDAKEQKQEKPKTAQIDLEACPEVNGDEEEANVVETSSFTDYEESIESKDPTEHHRDTL